jgi:hypothetical protein
MRRSRVIIWSGIVICLIPLLLVALLHLPWAQRKILAHVIHELKADRTIEIRLERFNWRPFSDVRLFQLDVRTYGEEFLRCHEASLTYELSLDRPFFRPLELFLKRPFLRLEKDSRGRWRLPHKTGPAPQTQNVLPSITPFWLIFPLPRLRLESASIMAYQDGQKVLSIADVDGVLSFKVEKTSGKPTLRIDLGLLKD